MKSEPNQCAGVTGTGPSRHSESLAATEALGAAGASHPRVTLADIEASIRAKYFASGVDLLPDDPDRWHEAEVVNTLGLLTICVLVMRNGFVVMGKSAPASPENFDRKKGETFAYEDAIRQLWPLMGYSLRDRLADSARLRGDDASPAGTADGDR